MNDKYDEWIKASTEMRDALLKKIENSGEEDIQIDYKSVALAFPSSTPHASHFEYPRIDEQSLFQWGNSNGWTVRAAPENASGEDKYSFPVRFTKIIIK